MGTLGVIVKIFEVSTHLQADVIQYYSILILINSEESLIKLSIHEFKNVDHLFRGDENHDTLQLQNITQFYMYNLWD